MQCDLSKSFQFRQNTTQSVVLRIFSDLSLECHNTVKCAAAPAFRKNLPSKSTGRTDMYPGYGGTSNFLQNDGNHLPNYNVPSAEDYYSLNLQQPPPQKKLSSFIMHD